MVALRLKRPVSVILATTLSLTELQLKARAGQTNNQADIGSCLKCSAHQV
jgi:hypothetical protein